MPHVHNGLHEYSRLLDAAARAVGEKSGAQDFTGIERFGETLTPTMDLWALPEWALLRGETIFSRSGTMAAGGAGTYASWELVNPTGSGILAVVLEVKSFQQVNTMEVAVERGAALGVVATQRGVANDSRFPQLGEMSRCTFVAGLLAGPISLPQDTLTPSERTQRPYIVAPGSKLWTIMPTANVSNSTSLLWTERPLLPTEGRA